LGAIDPALDQYAWGSISSGLAVLGDSAKKDTKASELLLTTFFSPRFFLSGIFPCHFKRCQKWALDRKGDTLFFDMKLYRFFQVRNCFFNRFSLA